MVSRIRTIGKNREKSKRGSCFLSDLSPVGRKGVSQSVSQEKTRALRELARPSLRWIGFSVDCLSEPQWLATPGHITKRSDPLAPRHRCQTIANDNKTDSLSKGSLVHSRDLRVSLTTTIAITVPEGDLQANCPQDCRAI